MENDPLPLPENVPEPACAVASVWRIEVPQQGYCWFTQDHSRVAFWKEHKGVVITAYAVCGSLP